MKGYKLIIGALVMAVLGALIGVGVYRFLDSRAGQRFSFSDGKPARYNVKNISLPSFDFAEVSGLVTSSVVHIKTRTNVRRGRTRAINPFDYFGEGFSFPVPRGPLEGSGSGVVITENGYIVTNNHVIHGADEIEVILNDRSSYRAELIGEDPNTDLALLQVKDIEFLPIKLGNSDDVRVGEWVLAVGNPFNLTSTVTAGIISARGRSLNILGGGTSIESFLQTDAVVNAGNSGGALVNSRGELVGINTAIATQTGQYMGYAFAVPVNIVKKVVEDIIEFGTVQRGFIGITIKEVDSRLAEEKGLQSRQGVFIEATVPGGAADASGIKKGDVIRKVEDKVINGVPDLQETIGSYRPGDKLKVTVVRNGEEKEMEVTLKTISTETR